MLNAILRRVFGLSKSPELGDVIGGGRRRDGSSSDWTLVCFLTGVRLGDDFRLFENTFRVFALCTKNGKVKNGASANRWYGFDFQFLVSGLRRSPLQ